MKHTYMPPHPYVGRRDRGEFDSLHKSWNLIFWQVDFAYMLDLDSLGFNVKVFLMFNNLFFVAVYIFENSFFSFVELKGALL